MSFLRDEAVPEEAASLPPQDGAKQNGCSIGHSSQAKRRPPSRLGAYFIDHVAVQVGLAYPENRKENDDVTEKYEMLSKQKKTAERNTEQYDGLL